MAGWGWDTPEAIERYRRLEKPVADSGAGVAACEAACRLAALAEDAPDAAVPAGLELQLEPPLEGEEVAHSRFGWRWGDRVFWLYLSLDTCHPPDEDAYGRLSLFVAGEPVLAMDVARPAADGHKSLRVDRATAFEPGEWIGQLWSFVEALSRSGHCGGR